MKQFIRALVIAGASIAAVSPAFAGDTKVMMPIAAAMATTDAQIKLGDSVKFYFANQPTPAVLEKLGSDHTSQKTNAVGKSHEKACNWVFLSDMLSLQRRAKELGANAVINITSNYDNVEFASATEFECHVGMLMAGVAFKADFVKVADK